MALVVVVRTSLPANQWMYIVQSQMSVRTRQGRGRLSNLFVSPAVPGDLFFFIFSSSKLCVNSAELTQNHKQYFRKKYMY